MAWVIGFKNISNPEFQALRLKILLSYLTVMVAILATSAVGVYHLFAISLYQQLNQRLEILAQAASHNLTAIEAQYQQRHETVVEDKGNEANKTALDQFPRHLDRDGDLDIPWQNLKAPDQGVEWFSVQGKLVGNAGTLLLGVPPQPGFQTLQQGQLRAVTLAVYSDNAGRPKLEGYVRTSELTQDEEAILNRLRWGLGLGSLAALSFTAVGGLWLTQQSLKPIEQSFQQLKQFTADASHELRSPLTAIKTSVEVMRAHPERIHPADVKKLSAIASATNQMTRLVEDLLLLARTDAAIATPTQQWLPIPLDEVLEDLVELLAAQAAAQKISLRLDLHADICVMGDAAQLGRLFLNLLENALSYTPAGGTIILAMSRGDRVVIVSVEDTGIGIASEHLPLIFQRFWRADQARSRRDGGLGLGLAIAQVIAQRHRGEITVNSQLGVGSCFRVRLPMA